MTNYSSIDILFLNTFLTSELRERDLSGCGTWIQLTDLTSKLEQVMQCFQGHWHQVKFGAAFLLQSPWQHSPVIAGHGLASSRTPCSSCSQWHSGETRTLLGA